MVSRGEVSFFERECEAIHARQPRPGRPQRSSWLRKTLGVDIAMVIFELPV